MAKTTILGLGGTIDYELHWDARILGSLAAESGIVDLGSTAPQVIDSERTLVLSVLHHLRAGTGGEHFVETPEVIERFAARFGYRTTLGGTPVRAALAMSSLGIGSTVHLVSIDDDVRRLLPADVDYLCSAEHDSTDPHLIVQYPANARIRIGDEEVVASSANRLIYPSDHPNAELRLSRDLPEALSGAGVFLISGMNSMQQRDTLDARLEELIAAMKSLPLEAVTIYENAGFHIPGFSQIVLDALAPHVDIVSLNEDELIGALERPVDLLDPIDLTASVREFAARVPTPTIVLHTRHFALAHGERASRMRAVLASGTAASGARYAYGDNATRDDVERLDANGQRSAAGQSLADSLQGNEEFCVVPAFDLQDVSTPTTIGLGDTFVGGAVAALVRAQSESRAEQIVEEVDQSPR
ncbi:ADP-dependent glucokinase/phosphofructokinase [Sinomonas humi]|uniref:ADP-dependent phosphofructokinase/glucokinase n=1 Tax=Sinomonas humi TaxID=1338436 RepID=A0A0B2ADW0_9MICC|nr:ADP-dependent glucokinase/phosphofructokinase [Sinomonas humi]KHL01405.1 hypothetical protein LK10_16165 [Sinomonas humi]